MAPIPNFDVEAAAASILDLQNDKPYQATKQAMHDGGQPTIQPWWQRLRGVADISPQQAELNQIETLTALVTELDARLQALNLQSEEDAPALHQRLQTLRVTVEISFGVGRTSEQRSTPALDDARAELLIAFHGTQVHALGPDPDRSLVFDPWVPRWINHHNDTVYKHLADSPAGEITTDRVAGLVTRLSKVAYTGEDVAPLTDVARTLIDAPAAPEGKVDRVAIAASGTVRSLSRAGDAGAEQVLAMVGDGMMGKAAFRNGLNSYFEDTDRLSPGAMTVIGGIIHNDPRLALLLNDTQTPARFLTCIARLPLTDNTVEIAATLLSKPGVLPAGAVSLITEPIRTASAVIHSTRSGARFSLTDYTSVRPLITAVLDTPEALDPYTTRGLGDLVAHFWPQSADELVRIAKLEAAKTPPTITTTEIIKGFVDAVGDPDFNDQATRQRVARELDAIPAENPVHDIVFAAQAIPEGGLGSSLNVAG